MARVSFGDYTDAELFAAYDGVIRELYDRGLVRTLNNPVADYAELLVAYALKGKPLKTGKGHDVVAGPMRVEVKSRRSSTTSKASHFGWIRGFEAKEFTHLALVLFDPGFSVTRAHLLTHKAVESLISARSKRVGARRVPIGKTPPSGRGIRELELKIPPPDFRWNSF